MVSPRLQRPDGWRLHIDARCSEESLAASEAQCISMKVIPVPAVDVLVVVVVVVVAARLGISDLVPEASSEASEASSLPSSDSLAPDARHR